MKRTFKLFLLTLSMLLVLGHAMVPHSHFFPEMSGICKPTDPSLADLVKATFSHDLGANHLKVYKGDVNTKFLSFGSNQAPAILSCSLDCRDFSTITTEKVTVFPVVHGYITFLSPPSLRAPPTLV
ncbi:MAG: hypothetical protein U5K79_24455 [Cyclobacteriaceae bacterium]|nr:hypothetical protein [Cyclobacteriaceae bacterium]